MKIEIAKVFYDFLEKRLESSEFEEWIYSNSNLESELTEGLYLELISLDYSDKSIRVKVEEIIDSKIDYAELHKNEVIKLINQIIAKEIDPVEGISKLYDWAEIGYLFIGAIELVGNFGEQGKSIVHSIDNKMSIDEKWRRIIEKSADFEIELNSLKDRIMNGSIVITGEKEFHKYIGKQFKYIEK